MHEIKLATLLRDPGLHLAVAASIHRGIEMVDHTHDFHELVYICRGRGIHVIDGHPYPIIAGDFYVMRPGEAHHYEVDAGQLDIFNVLMKPSLFPHADWAALCALPGLSPFLVGPAAQRHKLTLPPPHDHAVLTLC